MRRAIALSKKGQGFTAPNPLVGALIVKNNKIIGKGYHHFYTGKHAEVEAILDAKKKGFSTKDASLFVNLEPCCHFGSNPPCTEAILKAKIKQVFIGIKDPNPLVCGKGIAWLREKKIKVIENICKKECSALNEIFIHFQKTGFPFTAFKIANSLNGKIGIKGKEIALSGQKAQRFTHNLRQRFDAILTGVNTVLADDPQFNVRFRKKKKDPLRVILDPNLKLNKNFQIFKDNNFLLCVKEENLSKAQKKFKIKNILALKINQNNKFSFQDILKKLTSLNITSLLVESGSSTLVELLKQKIPQKGYFIQSAKFLFSSQSLPILPDNFAFNINLKVKKISKLENDVLFEVNIDY